MTDPRPYRKADQGWRGCCICEPPQPERVYGAWQCKTCGRPCGENYAEMRAIYLRSH